MYPEAFQVCALHGSGKILFISKLVWALRMVWACPSLTAHPHNETWKPEELSPSKTAKNLFVMNPNGKTSGIRYGRSAWKWWIADDNCWTTSSSCRNIPSLYIHQTHVEMILDGILTVSSEEIKTMYSYPTSEMIDKKNKLLWIPAWRVINMKNSYWSNSYMLFSFKFLILPMQQI